MIDLRSDTVTRPTPAMRRAMADAEVGDDVMGEDPTVRRLEERTAALLEKEAALFVPSGTMANQIALSLLADPGTEVIVHEDAHILNYEGGAASALWGITLRTVSGDRGRVHPDVIRSHLRSPDPHVAPVRAVAVENTHNRAGGAVWSPEDLDAVFATAKQHALDVHVDGARLWNAAAAGGHDPARLVGGAATVSVCFSKGLGAPVGSAVVSTAARIDRARFVRKRLGGGMRQAGIIAAGALHALEHHRERLAEDHRRAARLGEVFREHGVATLPVESNLVIAEIAAAGRDPDAFVRALGERGVLAGSVGRGRVRLVTHLDVDDTGLRTAVDAVRAVLGAAT